MWLAGMGRGGALLSEKPGVSDLRLAYQPLRRGLEVLLLVVVAAVEVVWRLLCSKDP